MSFAGHPTLVPYPCCSHDMVGLLWIQSARPGCEKPLFWFLQITSQGLISSALSQCTYALLLSYWLPFRSHGHYDGESDLNEESRGNRRRK